MTLADAAPGTGRPDLVARATAIITRPDTEWQVIDHEPATVGSVFTRYILILAAIPPVCRFIGGLVFGYGFLGVTYRPSFLTALSTAIASYVLSVLGIFVVALIVDVLAPSFDGQKDRVQAVKLVGYAATASWLAGVFALVPGLGFLSLLGLYSFYLFYKGLPVLMKSPREKRAGYTAVVLIAALIVNFVIWPIAAGVVGTTVALVGTTGALVGTGGTVNLPGGAELKLDQLQQAAKTMEDAASRARSSGDPAGVPIDTLKQVLPASLGGVARQDISSAQGQIAGFGGSNVRAQYGAGGRTITLSVTDLGAAGALSALGSALGIKGSQQNGSSYTRMDQAGGRTIIETYDGAAKSGDVSVILANRFLVNAQGTGVALEDLRGAVNAADLPRLEALAK